MGDYQEYDHSQRWKEETVPTKEDWQQKLMVCAEKVKLTRRLRDQEERCFNVEQGNFLDYMKNFCKHLKSLAGLT